MTSKNNCDSIASLTTEVVHASGSPLLTNEDALKLLQPQPLLQPQNLVKAQKLFQLPTAVQPQKGELDSKYGSLGQVPEKKTSLTENNNPTVIAEKKSPEAHLNAIAKVTEHANGESKSSELAKVNRIRAKIGLAPLTKVGCPPINSAGSSSANMMYPTQIGKKPETALKVSIFTSNSLLPTSAPYGDETTQKKKNMAKLPTPKKLTSSTRSQNNPSGAGLPKGWMVHSVDRTNEIHDGKTDQYWLVLISKKFKAKASAQKFIDMLPEEDRPPPKAGKRKIHSNCTSSLNSETNDTKKIEDNPETKLLRPIRSQKTPVKHENCFDTVDVEENEKTKTNEDTEKNKGTLPKKRGRPKKITNVSSTAVTPTKRLTKRQKLSPPKSSPKANKTPKQNKRSKTTPVKFNQEGSKAEGLPAGWKKMGYRRRSGVKPGVVDTYWFSPSGQKFRSKVSIVRYMEKESANNKKGYDPEKIATFPNL